MKKFFSGPFLPAALALCLFFIVVGAHWAAVDRFGSDIPNWDQWDAEGLNLLAPWFEHDHFVAHLFQPHNEHRVVVTKLHNLALALLDGQWDARLECVTNAALHAALAVAFWLLGRRWLVASKRGEDGLTAAANCGAGFTPAMAGVNPALQNKPSSHPALQALLFIALAALFAVPVAWQNVLGGFHSQQYWLLLLSFAAMISLPFERTWSAGWWAAAFAGTLSLLTMGSGFFAAAMVFALLLFRLVRRETILRAAWPTLLLTLALVVVGWFTRVEVDYHQSLKAKTAHDFFLSILHSLQWPAPRAYSWLAAVLWLPWVLTAWCVVRSKSPSRSGLTVVALGGWVLAQIIATAYARGVGGDYPASRYMDTLAFGTAANALALTWLLSGTATPRCLKIIGGLFGVAWLGVFAWGVYDLGHLGIMVEMQDVKRFYIKAEAHMRGYLATNDPAQLAFDDIPYPGAGSLIERLNHASLSSRLPVSIRPPLPLLPAVPDAAQPVNAHAAFLENHASQLLLESAPRRGLSPDTGALASLPTWGSFDAGGVVATGEWTSAPLTAPLGGWLKFETAGDIGREGETLALCDAQTHALLADVRPTKIPGNNWRAAYVRAPRVPFIVVARDESASGWLAFSAPVEMGTLSYLAWQCAKNGLLVLETAAAAAALLGLAALAQSHLGRSPATKTG